MDGAGSSVRALLLCEPPRFALSERVFPCSGTAERRAVLQRWAGTRGSAGVPAASGAELGACRAMGGLNPGIFSASDGCAAAPFLSRRPAASCRPAGSRSPCPAPGGAAGK